MPFRQATGAIGWTLLGLLTWMLSACGPNIHERYLRLPEQDKELFDRSRQFMTDSQQEKFLGLEDSVARTKLVEELHISDRLSKYPSFIQEAILGQRVVPGMSPEAVILSWGKPLELERLEQHGIPSECWRYLRGNQDGRLEERNVTFVKGFVTEISP